MHFKVSEVHCLLYYYYYISAAGVALDFLVSYFLWQVKYLSCDELAEKTDMHFKLCSTPLKSEIMYS